MSKIKLNDLELKTFTEQDALDYCQLNSINFDDITELYLSDNQLTDISVIQNLNTLKYPDIDNLESDQIQYKQS